MQKKLGKKVYFFLGNNEMRAGMIHSAITILNEGMEVVS